MKAVFLWDQLDSNQRPIGYASHYCFRNFLEFVSWTIPLSLLEGYLPSSLYTFPPHRGLGSGLSCLAKRGLDFPEFDR